MSNLPDDVDGRITHASAWIEENNNALSFLMKKPPRVRAQWLDSFIMSNIMDINKYDDADARVDGIGDLFVLVRELQLRLKLRVNDPDSYHLNAFTPLVQELTDRSSEVLPGSYSGSRKHLEFKLGVFKEIERQFPVITDDRGFAIDNGYGHDVSRLLSLTGFVPSNIGVRPISNLNQRVDHGLTNKIPDDFLAMLDDFLLLMYGVCCSKSIRIEGKSQSGLPLRAYGKGYKTVGFINAVNNLDDVLAYSKDPRYLLDHYDILYAFLQGNRQSPDAGGKKRYITTQQDNAVGKAGVTLQDNHPRLDAVPAALRKHFATMRYRFVWGGNSISNAIVNCIGTSCRYTYGYLYEFTFKHRGKDDLMTKLQKFYGKDDLGSIHKSECDLVVIDVTSFDLNYPKDILLKYVDFFKDTKIYDFFFRTAFAPSVQGTHDKGDKSRDPIVNGDLFNFDPSTYVNSGLPSGWSWVSDAGKVMALNIYYCLVKAKLLEEHSLEQLHNFLLGKLEFGCFNLGDDNVIMGPNGSFDAILEALQKFSMWSVELEPGARFIGYPLFFDSFGNLKISHDPASYVTNWLTPERAIGGKFTKYWAYGLQQRERVYSDAPIVHSFRKIIMDKWREIYGSDLNAIIHEYAEKQRLELEHASGDDDILGLMYQRLEHSKDINLAMLIITDVVRDSSVLQWKWDSEDLLNAFNIKLEELEARPKIEYTNKVLEASGYSLVGNLKMPDDYHGGIYMHKLVPEGSKDFLVSRLRESIYFGDKFDFSGTVQLVNSKI